MRSARIEWLANGWARVTHAGATRNVSPRGLLSMPEATAALGTYYMRLERMAKAGKLRVVPGPAGRRMIPMVEIRRVLKIGLKRAAA